MLFGEFKNRFSEQLKIAKKTKPYDFLILDLIRLGLSQRFRGNNNLNFVAYGSKVININMSEILDK